MIRLSMDDVKLWNCYWRATLLQGNFDIQEECLLGGSELGGVLYCSFGFSNQRMSQQCINDKRQPNRAGQ